MHQSAECPRFSLCDFCLPASLLQNNPCADGEQRSLIHQRSTQRASFVPLFQLARSLAQNPLLLITETVPRNGSMSRTVHLTALLLVF